MTLKSLGFTTPEQDQRLLEELNKLDAGKYTTRTICRCCGSADLTELFSLGEQHLSGFPLPPCGTCGGTGEVPYGHDGEGEVSFTCSACDGEPYSCGPKVPITIQLCRSCTLVQAKHTPAADLYSGHYWYQSSRNQSMKDALKDIVVQSLERIHLEPGDIVLDIGSNDGCLLRHFKELAPQCVTVAVEPAANLKEVGSQGVDVFISDFWSAEVYNQVEE